MKILNGAHVERDISVDQFEGIVGTSGLTITSPLLKMRCLQRKMPYNFAYIRQVHELRAGKSTH